jgi:hypothetical protein
MKKYLLIFISTLFIMNSLFGLNWVFAGDAASNNCKFELNKDWTFKEKWLTWLLDNCMKETTVVAVKWDWKIEWAFKEKINGWTNNIALFLALLSVGSIIYGGLMMTLSAWEDEKIKKAKDIVKWSLIGFLGVVLATTIVTLVINIIYGLAPATT